MNFKDSNETYTLSIISSILSIALFVVLAIILFFNVLVIGRIHGKSILNFFIYLIVGLVCFFSIAIARIHLLNNPTRGKILSIIGIVLGLFALFISIILITDSLTESSMYQLTKTNCVANGGLCVSTCNTVLLVKSNCLADKPICCKIFVD